MFYADLTPYVYDGAAPRRELLSVGWLDNSVDFPSGVVSERFLRNLARICERPLRATSGIHACTFCSGGRIATGNAEIRIIGQNGQIYAAPTLIFHYVIEHHYLPPQEFVNAVEQQFEEPELEKYGGHQR